MTTIDTHAHHAGAHGDHDDHAHHHVSSMFTLVFVLAVLLLLTIATFSAGFIEVWIAETWNVVIPQWINVAVAMSIATVKGVLVLLYFMHLRHDNPLNSIILLFSLFAFALFLGLTMIDLGSRGMVYDWKKDKIIEGGNAVGLNEKVTVDGQDITISAGTPLAQWVKDPVVAAARLGEAEYQDLLSHKHYDAAPTSDAQRSRARTGLTKGLFDVAPAGDGHKPGDDASHGEGH